MMNSGIARYILRSLNPGVHFEVGDVNRLPLLAIEKADDILANLEASFDEHERAREASIEFTRPGYSTWRYTQEWAQLAVDRKPGEPLPPFDVVRDEPSPADVIGFAVGVAFGTIEVPGRDRTEAPATHLPHGILFVACEGSDSLDLSACTGIHESWAECGGSLGASSDLRTFMRRGFFEHHKKVYEGRPVYFPLSSSKKNFVAFISIHRWSTNTLTNLLAFSLVPAQQRLRGELDDLRTARALATNKAKSETRFVEVHRLLEELSDFIVKVSDVAEMGPPPPDETSPRREVDTQLALNLDDGVVVNSAALWPLLDAQWKDPKKWWWQLVNQKGPKGSDYDWSRLAARYFPDRVRKKCHDDPSLAVAHKCFWELHPAKAYAWELRLQDEIRQDFTIDEPGSNNARAKFLAERDYDARKILAKELKRRDKKNAKADEESDAGPLFDQAADQPEESDD